MFNWHRKSILHVKGFIRISPVSWLRVLPQYNSSPRAPSYSTDTSKRQSFRMNYLVDNCGFSSETASELSKHVSFLNSKNADAVLNLFRNLNISDSKIRDTIKKAPALLSSNPVTNISPKLEFFKSKGASTYQLARIMTTPRLFRSSLENQIIPSYDVMKRFLHSDERTITSITRYPRIMTDCRLEQNLKLLLDYGVSDLAIAFLLRHWPQIINCRMEELKNKVDEVKELGFSPSKTSFIEALHAKVLLRKSWWEKRVELYGRWGWSDETLRKAFIKRPSCMLTSDSKIEAVMQFFVNQMGWNSSVLAKYPMLLEYSLEKRIIPRASVLQFLQLKGLIEKHASDIPFSLTEEKFLQKFVHSFKDEAPQLLNLYKERSNLLR